MIAACIKQNTTWIAQLWALYVRGHTDLNELRGNESDRPRSMFRDSGQSEFAVANISASIEKSSIEMMRFNEIPQK